MTPETVVPSCLVPAEVVVSGSPRSHSPVVALSVALGFTVQPRLVSKLSKNTVTGPAPGTVKLIAWFLVVAPLVPEIVKGYVPAAVVVTVTVAVDDVEPLAGGVTGLVEKAHDAPAGRPEQASVTALAKPLVELTVQVLVPLAPVLMVKLDGAHETAKSGVTEAAGVTFKHELTRE